MAEDQKLQDAENARRRKLSDTATALVDKLRAEYLQNQFGDEWASPGAPQSVPDEWINSRLRERGLDWTYAGQREGGYTMSPGKSAFQK
ncbi:MAG: hypothetical protein EON58_21970 [Alphaproteobacteria bacterium]|nr:MAG: hypothetical protein EON58_21970 [Alphaproteobacteria bacterium]